jgi:hypothetical protein
MWVVNTTGNGWYGQKIQHLLLVEIESLATTGLLEREKDECFRESECFRVAKGCFW